MYWFTEANDQERAVSVIASPVRNGQSQAGVEWGPGFLLRFTQLNQRLTYHQNHLQRKYFPIQGLYQRTYQMVLHEMHKGRFTLTLGGDHSLTIASLTAALAVYPHLRIIWVDAHADINTPTTSPSGHLHGMPVAALMGLFDLSYQSEFKWLRSRLSAHQIMYLGVRDLDSGERDILKKNNIKVISIGEIRTLGMERVFFEIRNYLSIQRDTPVYTSIDVDGIDPQEAPATGLRIPDGIKLSELMELIERIKFYSHWVGTDFVEFNPFAADTQDELLKTLKVADSFFNLLPWPEKESRNSIPTQPVRGSCHLI